MPDKKPRRRSPRKLQTNNTASSPAPAPGTDHIAATRAWKINGAAVRHVNFEGRDHLIVPVVAVVEGVLNGGLLTFDEISAYPQAWNGIPLPVNHPRNGEEPISANSPDVLEKQVLGRFFNAHLDAAAKSLKGELWIDVLKAQAHADGPEILRRLEAGEQLEVSTAYFCDLDETPGVFNSEKYSAVQHNVRPDHLALLPNGIGACNWTDGCGAPRVNAVQYLAKDTDGIGHLPYTGTDGKPDHKLMGAAWAALHGGYRGNKYQGPGKAAAIKKLKAVYKSENMPLPASNEQVFTNFEKANVEKNRTLFTFAKKQALSFDEITCMIRDELNAEDPAYYYWIQDVFDTFVVYQSEARFTNPNVAPVEPVLTMRDYAIDVDGNLTFGKPVPVERQISYIKIPVSNSHEPKPQEAQTNMEEKKKIVDALIANDKTIWKEAQREFLMTLSECDLKALGEPAPAAAPAPAPAVNQAPAPKTLDEFINALPDQRLKNIITQGIATHDSRKADLVKTLSENKACAFTKPELEGMELPFLEKLAQSQGVSFEGAGVPRLNRQTVQVNDDDAPEPPAVLTAPVTASK